MDFPGDFADFPKNPCTYSENRLLPHFSIKRNFIMSQHPSFKAGTGSGKKRRNVLKRFERVALLSKRGQWKEGDRVSGLVKTKPDE
jgi:small basic protein (TIGR04137 family)